MMKPSIDRAQAHYVIQNRRDLRHGTNDIFPWPSPFGSVQSAKNKLRDHLAQMAQHHGLEEPPKLEWKGDRSNAVTFGSKEYSFEIRGPERRVAG